MLESKFQIEGEFDSPGEKMSRANKHLWDLHSQELVKFSDEELCHNARQGCAASRNLLWKRYVDFIRIVVHKENKHQHLPPHEITDALQELYFAFNIAVRRYNPENHCHGKLASFKTFLKIVVAHAFSNYCTLWRIYQKHIALDSDDEAPSRPIAGAEEAGYFSFYQMDGNGHTSFDWQAMLLGEPSSDSLAVVLKRLKPKEKHLLEVWLQYGRDKEVAKILGISPVAAKLRRERLFCRIRQSVTQK